MAARTNQELVIEAWNTVLFEKFSRFEHILTTGLAGHGTYALARHPVRPESRVIDIGCGFGDATRAIAASLGRNGHAVGVDCAENFVGRAAADATASGSNATFFTADVQSDDLRGPYDRAFSRFGTMFFDQPGAALRNVRKALLPGGELTMVVWRRREDNPWLHAAEQRVRAILPPAETDSGAVHCGPGPFSMAGADLVSDLLRASGYEDITFERFDTDICIGRSLEEAVEFAMALGPAGEMLRLAGPHGVACRPQVHKELQATLTEFLRSDGVWAGSSTWTVTARNPVH